MKQFLFVLATLLFFYSCKESKENQPVTDGETNPESIQSPTDKNAVTAKDYTEFKVLDSKYINVEELWVPFNQDLEGFTEEQYNSLKPLIIEQNIPTLQKEINQGQLSYENLVKFYLYRIRKFDRKNDLSLNSVIALNPKVISEAKQKDIELKNRMLKPPLFGMPILLKDNIGAKGMPTTAGAVALQNNNTDDAFIVKQLKDKGVIILGKTNLSEWANYFSGDSPNGYSAIGGQTLNPYGRRTLDTGGSSSGSGVAVATNFCVAAVGSETDGSILSPSSRNSVVGLKPTIGLLSRSGIVPISSTLDTPGPMTKNVVDNALMLDAMFGEDKSDSKSIYTLWESGFYSKDLKTDSLKGKRFGVFKGFLKDTLFSDAIAVLKQRGAEIIELEEENNLSDEDEMRLLNLDMKKDLPAYLSTWAGSSVEIKSVQDVVEFNKKDSLNRMPYGQRIFEGIVADSASNEEFEAIKTSFETDGKQYLDSIMDTNNLDGILSINSRHSSYAAAAEYPAITVPMGYDAKGAPEGLTFIGKRLQEKLLLQWAYAYEQASKMRKPPKNYN